MKKLFTGISATMILSGLVLAGASHPDPAAQVFACTAGVLIMAAGALILTVINS